MVKGKQTQTEKAGHWVFPGNQIGRYEFSKDAEILSIRFSITWRSGTPLFSNEPCIVFPSSQFPALEVSARSLIVVMTKHLGDPKTLLGLSRESLETHFAVMHSFYQWSSDYVHTMLSFGLPPNTPMELDSRVDTAMAWLRNRPFTEPWREPVLASVCGLSVSQLNRLFVRYHGQTPVSFYEAHRFDTVAEALLGSDRDIKSIAYEWGFSSPGNFSSWFKKKSGTSPRAWRRKKQRRSK